MAQESTSDLTKVLTSAKPEQISDYLTRHAASMVRGERPFAAYMRDILNRRGIKRQELFLRADIPEGYGYKLLSQEKRTRQRDYILRLCLAAGMNLKETQRALELYEMPTLYAKIPRDAVLIIAFNTGVHNVMRVNDLLMEHDMEPLRTSGVEE